MEEGFFGVVESYVYQGAEWIALVVEAIGVLVIIWGIILSVVCYGGQLFSRTDQNYVALRLSLARYLVVALEFQLAADILGTAIAPNWNGIGKLAAIAVIRTVLNHFLQREMREEVAMQESGVKDKFNEQMEEGAERAMGTAGAQDAPTYSSSSSTKR